MKNTITTDFDIMTMAMGEYVRRKAIKAGNTNVYKKDGELIEDDPATFVKHSVYLIARNIT